MMAACDWGTGPDGDANTLFENGEDGGRKLWSKRYAHSAGDIPAAGTLSIHRDTLCNIRGARFVRFFLLRFRPV